MIAPHDTNIYTPELNYVDQDELGYYIDNSNKIDVSDINKDKTNYYLYPGLELLNKQDVELFVHEFNNVNIHVCTYQVNTTGMAPFLQFILRKYDKSHVTKSDLLCFPSFKYIEGEYTIDICNLIEEVICFSYRSKKDRYKYKGFINNENNFYVFYELEENTINIHDLYRKNDLWPILMDEIINHESACNFRIDKNVSNFFKNNIEFSYLLKLNGDYFETPIVAYTGCKNKQINIISCFGVSETMEEYLPEPYFYFTNYQTAIKMGGFLENKNNRGGVIRFALFTGYMMVILNNSEINLENVKNYDSIYIINNSSPKWALKKWEQQTPLTCHYIDYEMLGENWENDASYYIY
jgi:hypothetical protein